MKQKGTEIDLVRVGTRRKERSKAPYLEVDTVTQNKEEINSEGRARQDFLRHWCTGGETFYRVSLMSLWAGNHLLWILIQVRHFVDCKPLNVKDAIFLMHLSMTAQMLPPL